MRDVPQLKLVREDQGWSQRTLAAKSGVAQNTISQLERGERKAMPSTIRKLADALGVDPPVLMAESRIDAYIPRERQTVGEEPVSSLPSEGRERQRHLGALKGLKQGAEAIQGRESAGAPESKTILELAGERMKEDSRVRKEWYETGRWAEYYVSGELANREIAFAEAHKFTDPFTEELRPVIRSDIRFHAEREYLLNIPNALRSYTGDLAAVRSRLITNDPKETILAAQLVLSRAKRIVEEHDGYLQSFRRIPDRYYEDSAAHSRILKLQAALSEQRVAVADDVRELMDLYDESLDTLEDQVIAMRKEGNVLEEFVTQVHDWEG